MARIYGGLPLPPGLYTICHIVYKEGIAHRPGKCTQFCLVGHRDRKRGTGTAQAQHRHSTGTGQEAQAQHRKHRHRKCGTGAALCVYNNVENILKYVYNVPII